MLHTKLKLWCFGPSLFPDPMSSFFRSAEKMPRTPDTAKYRHVSLMGVLHIV